MAKTLDPTPAVLLAHAIEGIPLARDGYRTADAHASELEERAKILRRAAEEDFARSFAGAIELLAKQIEDGKLSQLEIVDAIVGLHNNDPSPGNREYSPNQGVKIIDAVRNLVQDAPVVGLYSSRTGGTLSGIVAKPPEISFDLPDYVKNDEVRPWRYTPYSGISIPFVPVSEGNRGADNQETVIYTDLSYLPTAAIGQAAIQKLVNTANFKFTSDGTRCHSRATNNAGYILRLRRQIDGLYELGMPEIDTSNLDSLRPRAELFAPKRF